MLKTAGKIVLVDVVISVKEPVEQNAVLYVESLARVVVSLIVLQIV